VEVREKAKCEFGKDDCASVGLDGCDNCSLGDCYIGPPTGRKASIGADAKRLLDLNDIDLDNITEDDLADCPDGKTEPDERCEDCNDFYNCLIVRVV
jgi:hypothetical protein